MFSRRTDWPTAPNRLSAALARRRSQGLPIIDLTESNPTRCGFVFDEQAVLKALANPAALRYEPHPRGLPAAREAVTAYYSEQGVTLSPDQLVLTTGTSEAYSFLMRLVAEPGDEILSPSPSYPLLDYLAGLNDLTLVRYPLLYDHGWQLDLDRLKDSITPRSRAIIVVTPNNPTGSFLSRAELDALTEVASRHGLALIADEVFRDYAWQPDPARAGPLAAVSECLTFTLNGLSKVSALPQLKLAWIAVNGPGQLQADALSRLEIIADTYLSVSTPIQHATGVLLEQRRKLQPQILARVRDNLGFLDWTLETVAPVTRLAAEGGWYAILRLPHTQSDEDQALALLENDGVYVHPGHLFDFEQEGRMVVSLIPNPGDFQAGVLRILRRASAPA